MSDNDKQYEIAVAYTEMYANAIAELKPVLLEVRDHDTYEMLRVKAIVAKTPAELEAPHVCWIRNIHELLEPDPIAIQILEMYDEDEVRISSVPKTKWEYYSGRERE